jgi:DNA mismatch repair protein MutS
MPTTTTGKSDGGDATDTVPLRRQYLQIKARYPETILFFRLGDFYETFDDDAEIAARVLDIVLTGREMGKNLRVPMAGIPYHAADGYIARLIGAGHKVAVCEQVGEVARGKGLVERDVTRVITPGTISDPAMLDARTNNFIVGVAIDRGRAGVAFADITTGEFRATEFAAADTTESVLAVGRELLRLGAAEIVVSADLVDSLPLPQTSWIPELASLSRTDAWRWQTNRSEEVLLRHFNVESLDGFGLTGKLQAIRAAGGLLRYLEDTQLSGLKQIDSLSTYSIDAFMTLDLQTRRNLELTESSRGDKRHSLQSVLNQTQTAMGARMLNRWIGQPLLDIDAVNERLDAVQWFVESTDKRAKVRDILKSTSDVERLSNRVVTGTVTPRDLASLRDSLVRLPAVTRLACELPGLGSVPTCSNVQELLHDALAEDAPASLGKGGVFRPGYASELDAHRARAREAREWIANLERTERDNTGIRTLKVGYNRVFGYYLEVTTAALASAERDRLTRGENGAALPADYIPKQSLANATRYFTPQLKEYEALVLTAQDTLASLEADIYRTLVLRVAENASDLCSLARAVAYIDTTSALADVAVDRSYVRPSLNDSGQIELAAGRHPVLESILPAGEYVPNGACLNTETDQIVILTGPNMAGKSSWLRQVALIALMAQIGSYVPAESASIGIVDRIFTRIGAQDDIATGQSTFMVEMLETANILNHATSRSLIVLDEIGRGTSTYDGLAIARAIVEYIHNSAHLGCKTLFATHFHELTELAGLLPRVKTYRMDVLDQGDQVVFLRQVVPGGADRSYGIHVAQLAGIPRSIIRRAEAILSDLEREHPRNDRRSAMQQPIPEPGSGLQLTFFDGPNPAVERLKSLDLESISPLEAINELFELKRRLEDA